jgi:hypothetical protein
MLPQAQQGVCEFFVVFVVVIGNIFVVFGIVGVDGIVFVILGFVGEMP